MDNRGTDCLIENSVKVFVLELLHNSIHEWIAGFGGVISVIHPYSRSFWEDRLAACKLDATEFLVGFDPINLSSCIYWMHQAGLVMSTTPVRTQDLQDQLFCPQVKFCYYSLRSHLPAPPFCLLSPTLYMHACMPAHRWAFPRLLQV